MPDYWRGAVRLPDGKKRYVSADSREVAQYQVDELLERLRNGEEVRSKAVGTVAEECQAWLELRSRVSEGKRKRKLTASTVRTYQTAIVSVICRKKGMTLCIGNVNAATLKSGHIRRWLRELSAAGKSDQYLRQAFSVLNQTMEWLAVDQSIPANPCASVPRPEKKDSSGVGLQDEELDSVMDAISGHRLYLRWLLAFTFGVRPAEAIAIRRKDFQLNLVDASGSRYGILTICGQIDTKGFYIPWTKTKQDRKLKLNAELVADFESHLVLLEEEKQKVLDEGSRWHEFHQDGEWHDFLFRRPDGKNLTVSTDTIIWREITRAAGLPKATRYVARHTAASYLIGHGTDPLTAAEILGHQNPMVTLNVYGHALDKGKAAATDLMTGIMAAAKVRGRQAILTAGDSSTLHDLRDALSEFDFDTGDIEARIAEQKAAESDEARGPRPRRMGRNSGA